MARKILCEVALPFYLIREVQWKVSAGTRQDVATPSGPEPARDLELEMAGSSEANGGLLELLAVVVRWHRL